MRGRRPSFAADASEDLGDSCVRDQDDSRTRSRHQSEPSRTGRSKVLGLHRLEGFPEAFAAFPIKLPGRSAASTAACNVDLAHKILQLPQTHETEYASGRIKWDGDNDHDDEQGDFARPMRYVFRSPIFTLFRKVRQKHRIVIVTSALLKPSPARCRLLRTPGAFSLPYEHDVGTFESQEQAGSPAPRLPPRRIPCPPVSFRGKRHSRPISSSQLPLPPSLS